MPLEKDRQGWALIDRSADCVRTARGSAHPPRPMSSVLAALVSGHVLHGVPAAGEPGRGMTSFLIQYDRCTGGLGVSEFVGEHAREEALGVPSQDVGDGRGR
jgi:hypothetical protein